MKSTETELEEATSEAVRILTFVITRLEGLAKLIISLAAGALVLSVSLIENSISRGTCWKSFLILSWAAFTVTICVGLYVLYDIYSAYKELDIQARNTINNAEKEAEKLKSVSDTENLSFNGALVQSIKDSKLIEIKRRPFIIQLISFGIGTISLFITGILFIK